MHTCAVCTFQYAERLTRCLRCGAPKDPPSGGVREPREPKPQGPSPLQVEADSEERVPALL